MKIHNIVAGLLLIALSQGIYAIENTIRNYSNGLLNITLIYKNDKKETKQIGVCPDNSKDLKKCSIFVISTKANPIKKIRFNYAGTTGQWLASLDSTKNIDEQYILISPEGHVYLHSLRTEGGQFISVDDKWIVAEKLVDEV